MFETHKFGDLAQNMNLSKTVVQARLGSAKLRFCTPLLRESKRRKSNIFSGLCGFAEESAWQRGCCAAQKPGSHAAGRQTTKQPSQSARQYYLTRCPVIETACVYSISMVSLKLVAFTQKSTSNCRSTRLTRHVAVEIIA